MMNISADTILKVVLGLVVGWTANALTLSGRVDAIERSVTRIELALFPVPAAGGQVQQHPSPATIVIQPQPAASSP